MPTNKRKRVKMRGSKNNGHGCKCKSRGGGSRGGRGMCGGLGHKRFMFMKLYPDHFGKHGFKSIGQRFTSGGDAITLRDLERIIMAEKITGEVDVAKLGYGKVIGSGPFSTKISVKADAFSAGAEEKIIAVGGKVIKPEADELETQAGPESNAKIKETRIEVKVDKPAKEAKPKAAKAAKAKGSGKT